jgi:hypothetical protein
MFMVKAIELDMKLQKITNGNHIASTHTWVTTMDRMTASTIISLK